MKKTILPIFLSLFILFPIFSLAKNENAPGTLDQEAQGQGTPIQQGTGNSESVTQYQNQNQVQNAGEEQQLNNAFQQQSQTSGSGNGALNQKAGQVSKYVHELLNSETLTGGIGQQVREFAMNQNESQERVLQNMEKIQNRNQFTRFLFGTDRNAIAEMQSEMNRNQTRLLQLANIKEEITNPEDFENVEAYIESLREQNLELAQTIETESQSKGIFGWFIDLINNK